ncbi:MAG: pyruvate carboxyltransferase [Pseudodesulfovibrio sp.]|uniref:Pyruvate carboxyltransferase n=1 Tax=Pseudodesulfovibrio aespoeensis (strain ATCC 700646 / DSM 10631 / Aspo-2) TaxID=643562 RepID=E6VSQ1_PSEA9|nr:MULTISPECIES: pyruvate carboxyltransferase [Pseudodesulfovibrio]MBU4193052.1 pyruvate carboxyltransferase [Pseudomonadota bacterium]ADU62036.1 pyruvate carboxyltransferase [Pseudodesulfovibrio aespoeensis Aspo-2]MBU4244681.1 pyruvate carboxyltransferase [Pseudomonadota bacterium]MBU4378255.1 pyruvate carboxyltransferase [Pseudomonadota bacterium]MBU4474679.1 pyruvate carboxyltransferase [Pseudomonadota bacterium]
MLIDTTLREGAQLFGAYFTLDTREAIIAGLLDLGVEEIELGWVGQEGLETLVRTMRKRAGATRLSVWSPCREADVRAAAGLPVDCVNIGVPVSDAHMEKRLGMDRQAVLERITSTVLAARLMDVSAVSVGLEDVSRSDLGFALTAALTAAEAGASRVRLSDSLGILTPVRMQALIDLFRPALDIDLAVHCHDDFGMATANAVTALDAGADYADASVLGIGERSGIAATEELAAHLCLNGNNSPCRPYRTDGLRALCRFVSKAAGVPIPRTKSIAGDDIFACESGLHAHALSKSPDLFEPYDPARIGAGRRIAVGGKSGRGAVVNALADFNLHCPDTAIPNLVNTVRQRAWELRRPLTRTEFARLTEGCRDSEKNRQS